MTYDIPFYRPCIEGNELAYIAEAVSSGKISGDGVFTARCHEFLERELGVPKALLTPSCTHALEMAAFLLELKPGDEVIVPAFTFPSTANAFAIRGARPIFADIRPDTLNLDESRLDALITEKTKAIVPVHYAGVGCEMDAIMECADSHEIAVVEDNAHGLFGKYKGRNLGTFGALATQSFHETKNFTCGEGGCLLINRVKLIERAEIIREKGTNRSRFFRGLIDKYSWVDEGSSYLPSDLAAAFLYGQFENRDRIQSRRQRIWQTYAEKLKDWAADRNVSLPTVPDSCEQSYHMFYVLLPSNEVRERVIAHLKDHRILAVFHYVPLHLSDRGRHFGGHEGDCPVAETVSNQILRLPIYNDLTPDDQERVISVLKDAPMG